MKIVYLRSGDIPEFGKSLNHLTNEYEDGVSVWDAIFIDGVYRILFPAVTRMQWEYASYDIGSCYGKPMYLVTGEVLPTKGSIGETLLRNPVIVEEINPCIGDLWRIVPYKNKHKKD